MMFGWRRWCVHHSHHLDVTPHQYQRDNPNYYYEGCECDHVTRDCIDCIKYQNDFKRKFHSAFNISFSGTLVFPICSKGKWKNTDPGNELETLNNKVLIGVYVILNKIKLPTRH